MKVRVKQPSQENWFEDFKNRLLENTYWGKLAQIAELVLASALLHALLHVRSAIYPRSKSRRN